MKILLTGATGLVGQELGLMLVRQGHELTILTRDPKKSQGMLPFPARALAWDASKGSPPPEAFNGVEAVIHLAGESIASGRWSEERMRAIRDTRVQGTRNLVQGIASAVARGEKIRVFASASAVGIYGDRADETLTESSAISQQGAEDGAVGFLASVCREWEEAATQGLPASVRGAQIRIGIVLSDVGGALAEMLPVFKKGLGGALAGGRQWMSWIHVEDLARLFDFVIKTQSLSGPVNAVGPRPVTNRDFSGCLARALKKPAFFGAPGAALKVVLGDFAQAVLSSQRVLPGRVIEAGFEFRYPILESALAHLIPEAKDDRLRVRQWIPASLDRVFEFFSDAHNLERITPPFLNFQITGMSSPQIGQGTLIDYQLKIRGLPVKWRTLIERWKPKTEFVDMQLKGPYAKWHHTHRFEELAGGILIEDDVLYRLPMAWLGELVAGSWVKGDVEKIFAYRKEVIAGIFGSDPKSDPKVGISS